MILIVLAALMIPIATTAVWAKRTVLDESRFKAVASDIVSDPAVISATSHYLTNQLQMAVANSNILDNLPSSVKPIAAVLEGALFQRVDERVNDVLSSDTGQKALLLAIGQAHQSALRLLQGDGLLNSSAFTVKEGKVTLNLLPAARIILLQLQQDGVIPASVSIPAPDAPPGSFATALSARLPPDFGQVVVLDTGSASHDSTLDEAQRLLALSQRAVVLLVIVALALAVAAVLVAVDRRRATLLVGVGVAGVCVLLIVVTRHVARAVPDITSTPGAHAVADALAQSLRSSLVRALLIVAIVGAVLAIVTWQQAALMRLAGRSPDIARIVVVALGVLILLILGLSWVSLIFAIVVVAAGLVAVQRAGARAPTAIADTGGA